LLGREHPMSSRRVPFPAACRDVGRRRPDLADATIEAYACTLAREFNGLLKLKSTRPKAAIFETSSSSIPRTSCLSS
jgi:hypothetical protein